MKAALPVASPVSLQPKGTRMKMKTTRRSEGNEVSVLLYLRIYVVISAVSSR